MLRRAAGFVSLFFALAWAVNLSEIQINGADPVITSLARVALPVSEGDNVEPQDLPKLQEAVMGVGYFRSVTMSLNGSALVVELEPNPRLSKVEVVASALPPEALENPLRREFAISEGSIYNPVRAEAAAQRIGAIYASQGYPFTPNVKIETGNLDKERTDLRFVVEESAPLEEVVIEGVSLFSAEEVSTIAKPLRDSKNFTFPAYQAMVLELQSRYNEAGYTDTRIDPRNTRLEAGILTVQVQEPPRVTAIDPGPLTSAIQIPLAQPLNQQALLDEIERLSREASRVVEYRTEPVEGGIKLVFSVSDVEYGIIEEVRIVGAEALPAADLAEALRLQSGSIYSPALAEQDFRTLLETYQKAGYQLVPRPQYSFSDGVYTQQVSEIKIAGYQLNWNGDHRTREQVILREMPAVGAVFSTNQIRSAITDLLQLRLLAEPPQVFTAPGPTPEQVIVVMELREAPTTVVAPAVAWSSLDGWSGQISVADENLFGLGHQGSLLFSFLENDAQDNLEVRASYAIPWVYANYGDFREVPTRVQLQVYTYPYANIPLKNEFDANTGWQYTERRTGVELGASRAFSAAIPNLRIGTSLEGEWVQPKLEGNPDEEDEELPSEGEAVELLPDPYQSYVGGLSATYDTSKNRYFPTFGYVAGARVQYGWQFPENSEALQFTPLSLTYKTYVALDSNRRHILALRGAAGTILGDPPNSRLFFLGGSEPEISTLRGYRIREFSGSDLVGGSAEYRYDFRLSSEPGKTNVYGILFYDVGSVWDSDQDPTVRSGYGLGVQLDLGLGSILLPAIRFDYGFSEERPEGVLHFRLGPVF